MALSTEQIDQLTQLLATDQGRNPLPQLRAQLPGLSVTRCDAEDMRGETPYRASARYDLFLVDTSRHCWRIVADPQNASGVVIAAKA